MPEQTGAVGKCEEDRKGCRSTGEAEESRNRALAGRRLRHPSARVATLKRPKGDRSSWSAAVRGVVRRLAG